MNIIVILKNKLITKLIYIYIYVISYFLTLNLPHHFVSTKLYWKSLIPQQTTKLRQTTAVTTRKDVEV